MTKEKAPPTQEKETSRLLEEEKRKGEEYLTKLKYLQADFENYRKRVGKELMDAEDASVSRLVSSLLPIIDALELAEASARSNDRELADGISMVHRNLMTTLEGEGLRAIEAVGKPFNPRLHEAVEKVQGDGEEDMVIEEVRRGFFFRDKILRPSMVKVALASKEEGPNE